MSEVSTNDASRRAREDQEDLAAFDERAAEEAISYEALLKDLKASRPRVRRPSSSRHECP
jgi:hypothetical protein